jgi:TolB-like protein/Flp pilus assembly protein TadD
MKSLFAELKRRNVYKVAVAYAVVGWLVIQITSTVLPTFHAPEWVAQTLVLLVLLAFPIALVLAWAFELTPDGIKRAEDVPVNDSITRRTGSKIVRLTIAAGVIAAALLAWQTLGWRRATSARSATTVDVPPLSATVAAIPAKSIAVLPFDNLSHDPENAYFSEGIQDEILTRLAKITDLKVISRISTQRFTSAPGDLRQIAQQLGVTNIVEGSVQKSGDAVRINVQLINALTDAHLWADTYDRKLVDIFAVESEVAKSVAETLQAKLTGSAERVLASRPTANAEAHQLYLKGRYFWNKRGAPNLKTAVGYFEQAIAKDPNYALAYAGLADAHALLPQYARNAPKEDIPQALAAARKAVELDDTSSEARTALANVLECDLQFAAGISEFQKAIALNPNYATAHHWYGEALQADGRIDEAVAELKRAQELDPLSVIINAVLGSMLGGAHRDAEAIEQLHKTMEMDPAFYIPHWFLGQLFENRGELTKAIVEYEQATKLDPDPDVLGSLGHAYAKAGRTAEARKILDDLSALSARRYISAYSLAIIHVGLGEKEEALRLLEKAYTDRDGDLTGMKLDEALDPLRHDARFQNLLERVMSGNRE